MEAGSSEPPETPLDLPLVVSPAIVLARITKVLISLRGCAGWSAPWLFSFLTIRLSCVAALDRVLKTRALMVEWSWLVVKC